MNLTITAIFKNESAYLREWLEFHILAGADSFLLYNNNSADNWQDTVKIVQKRARIEVIDWSMEAGQLPAYMDACKNHNNNGWMGFIDLDEFLFSPVGSLKDVLNEFENECAVGVNWQMFGSNGRQTAGPEPVIERFIRKTRTDDPVNTHVKSIVKPEYVLACKDPHHFKLPKYSWTVNENYRKFVGPFSAPVSVKKLRVNHYFLKSAEEGQIRWARGKADAMGAKRPWSEWVEQDKTANVVEDKSAWKFLKELKERMK